MRRIPLIALILLVTAAPSRAELNTYYRGTERDRSKEIPATAQFSIEAGRVALVMKGSHACRMLFFEKEGVLRFVDDGQKTYINMTKSQLDSMRLDEVDLAAVLEAQLAQIPPEQREAAKAMVQET